MKNKKIAHIALATFMAVSGLTSLALVQHAHAAALTQVIVRFDRMKQSTFTSGTVCAKPSSTATEGKVKVTFPTGFTVSSTVGNWTTDTTTTSGWPAGATAWLTLGATASTASGQDVTWTSGDLTAGTLYCFNWTNTSAALQTPSSPASSELGAVTTQTGAAADIDTAQYATATISNDQIVVTATVPPVFTFALSGNTDALGTLGTGSVTVSPTPRTATIGTNAKNGWQAWAKSALTNGGLNSASAAYTIPSNCSSGTGTNSTLSAGTEGYNTGLTSSHAAGSGAITIATPFVGNATGKGGGLCGALQTIATSTGTATADVLTLTNNVAISAATAAATDYTDTITVVAAGLF
jgi:hypothetical protein